MIARIGRRPWAWFAAAAVLGLATLVTTNRLLGQAAAARSEWSDRQTVVVTTDAVDPGMPITTANTTTVDLPRVALPDRTITSVPDGATAAARMNAGEIIHPSRLVATGDPLDGRVAVAVPIGGLAGLLGIGDTVDVWVTDDPFLARPGDAPSRPLVRGANVIDLHESTALLAVEDTAVSGLASAMPAAALTLTVVSRSAGR